MCSGCIGMAQEVAIQKRFLVFKNNNRPLAELSTSLSMREMWPSFLAWSNRTQRLATAATFVSSMLPRR